MHEWMWFPIWWVNNEMYCRHLSTGFPAGWPHLLPLWYCSTNLPLDNRKAFPVTRKSVVWIVKTSIDGYEWWTSMHSKWRAFLQSGKCLVGTFQVTLFVVQGPPQSDAPSQRTPSRTVQRKRQSDTWVEYRSVGSWKHVTWWPGSSFQHILT